MDEKEKDVALDQIYRMLRWIIVDEKLKFYKGKMGTLQVLQDKIDASQNLGGGPPIPMLATLERRQAKLQSQLPDISDIIKEEK